MSLARLAGRALMHPRLAALMLRAGLRFRAREWYRRPPFLPLPPAEYMAWRLHTAYGEDGRDPTLAELRNYLEWVVEMGRSGRSTRG